MLGNPLLQDQFQILHYRKMLCGYVVTMLAGDTNNEWTMQPADLTGLSFHSLREREREPNNGEVGKYYVSCITKVNTDLFA